MLEFQLRISNSAPEMIGVTEVKPKNCTSDPTPQEFSLKGYNLFHTNVNNKTGRGILMYIHDMLQAVEVTMETTFEEKLFLEIKLNNKDRLLKRCMYHSESGTQQNNNNLRKLIEEATSKRYSHILMMGDYNYKNIDWITWSTKSDNMHSEENLFVESLRDCNQQITKPTRIRGTNKPSTLDLVMTNEQKMVSDIEYHSPLGKSDHSMIHFNYQCYTKTSSKYTFH